MLGIINHLDLTVIDLEISVRFYKPILEFFDYLFLSKNKNIAVFRHKKTIGDIILVQASEDSKTIIHNANAPGLHHLAFNASCRTEVDELYKIICQLNVQIIDPPNEHNEYGKDYYAMYFEDPNGFKLELSFTPNQSSDNTFERAWIDTWNKIYNFSIKNKNLICVLPNGKEVNLEANSNSSEDQSQICSCLQKLAYEGKKFKINEIYTNKKKIIKILFDT